MSSEQVLLSDGCITALLPARIITRTYPRASGTVQERGGETTTDYQFCWLLDKGSGEEMYGRVEGFWQCKYWTDRHSFSVKDKVEAETVNDTKLR